MSLPVEYKLKRLAQEDYPGLEALFEASFGESDHGKLRKKLDTRRFGAHNVGYLAMSENQMAAYYGVYPVRMKVAGKIILGAQSADTMTAPEYRKKGLFLELARATYELARSEGVELVFGFPNEFSMPGFQRHLGWTFAPNMTGVTLRRSRWASIWSKSDHAIIDRLNEVRVADYPGQDNDGVLVDQDYLAYKAETAGSMTVSFEGFHAWLIPGKRIDVGGFVYTGNNLQRTLQGLLTFCGAQSLRFTYTHNHPQLGMLAEFCELRESATVGYLSLAQQGPKQAETAFEQMHFSRGDFDYF